MGTRERPRWTFAVAGVLGAALLQLLRFTWRIREEPKGFVPSRRAALAQAGRSDGPGTVYVQWHSRIALAAATHAGLGVHVLVSRHDDGEYIVRVIERLGFRTIRGSSTRGGPRALLELVRTLESGGDVAVTPDGPRGPRMRVQQGCVLAAMKSGAAIVPLGFECSRAKRLSSWDRFLVPLPFAKVAVVAGDPIDVPTDLDDAGVETWRARVEEALVDVTRRAAAIVGIAVESPDVDPRDGRLQVG